MNVGDILGESSPRAQVCFNVLAKPLEQYEIVYVNANTGFEGRHFVDPSNQDCIRIDPGIYNFIISGLAANSTKIELPLGSTTLVSITEEHELILKRIYQGEIIHVLYQMPQIILITFAEIFFCIAGVSFAYFEAPSEMKTLIVAVNYATILAGNLIVIAFTLAFEKIEQDYIQYFIYGALCLVGTMMTRVALVKYERENQLVISSSISAELQRKHSVTITSSDDYSRPRLVRQYSLSHSIASSPRYENRISSHIWASKMASGGSWDSTQHINAWEKVSRRVSILSIDKISNNFSISQH
ncbi:hypothetical protein Ciccas_008207 [Cichlidogyrus casuarinus]|uniref:Uncharacterized protein n=1 Tax=Cichlidogyrus casuarinus TaxID=1844966 RepID=A0ABD2Q4T3_9PLAT